MRWLLVVPLFYFSFLGNAAQDSLRAIIAGNAHDTTKVRAYLEICREVRYTNPEAAYEEAHKALALATSHNYKWGQG